MILEPMDGLLMSRGCSEKKWNEVKEYVPGDGDVFVASYHKSGTTWLQYIIWELANNGTEPPFVHEMMLDYGPRIEHVGVQTAIRKQEEDGIKRHFKTHLPFSFTPFNSKAKYIYVFRSPWDVCVSYFRQVKQMPQFYGFKDGSFDDFFHDFIDGWTDCGSYFDHVTGWLAAGCQHPDNMLVIRYEELKSDVNQSIKKVSSFLGGQYAASANDPEIMDHVLKFTSFDYMKTLPCVLPASMRVAKTGKFNVGKDVHLVETGDYKLVDFFKVGDSGYGQVFFSEHQKQEINRMVTEKFSDHPELVKEWLIC